ncbi:MAG: DUF624 domain-containing protein [Lachnospiraceae bacterium]|nr:DUF624 domain-containing protein [Lachnospiraceae bacterium]
MSKLFDIDSPLIQGLNRIADLMWLNVLTLVCCIPIITAGPALTAAHYVALKMKRKEEGYITKEFFKSFKMNFKQSTIIGLLIWIITLIFATDFYIIQEGGIALSNVLQVLLMAMGLLFVFTVIWVFPIQAKFINTIKATLKNAFALSIIHIPKTLLMLVVYLLPYIGLYITMRVFPLVLLFGISAPIYVSATLYNKMFKKLEEGILERIEKEKAAEAGKDIQTDTEEEDTIFSDKPIVGNDKL